jgi:membrane associated rhomboid family serine protease
MGLYDRDYTQADSGQQYYGRHQHYGAPNIRFNLPRLTPVVKWLLIANISIHLLQAIFFGAYIKRNMLTPIGQMFGVDAGSFWTVIQVWRLVTYQFLHGHGWHLFGNMLGLFFLGPTLERHWGSKRFIEFYLACGVAGGLFYLLLAGLGILGAGTMVGASGAILGMLAACAILFPHIVVFILLFPVPIRVAAIGFMLLFMLNVITAESNAGGDAAHLGGMAAGAAYVLLGPRVGKFKLKVRAGSWEKKIEDERKLQIEVDRILAKVHQHGLHSLSGSEKRILKKATREELKRQRL